MPCLQKNYNQKRYSDIREHKGGKSTTDSEGNIKKEHDHMLQQKPGFKQKFQKQYRIQDYTCPECKKIAKENERKAAAEQEEHERKLLAEA